MILIGTFDWASTRLRGMFVCPSCGTNEKFRLRASRPFLTLYFIPVLPIGGLSEFVQCGRCKESFETIVLANRMMPSEGEPEIELAKTEVPTFEEDLLRVVSLMMVEDGHVTENEIRIARRLYENMTEASLSRDVLGNMCSQVRLERLTTNSFLTTSVTRRSHEEKMLLVQAMFAVAGADGEVTPGRMESLVRAQKVMGLEQSEFQRAVESTSQWLV